MSNAYIPSRHFRTLLHMLREKGLSVDSLLTSAGLTSEFLQQPQDSYLTLQQVEIIIEQAVSLTHCHCLGVYLGQRLNLSAHGVVGFAGLCASTIGDALTVAQRFQNLVMPLVELNMETQGEITWMKARVAQPIGEPSKKFILDALMSSLYIQGSYLYPGSLQKVTAYSPYPVDQYEEDAQQCLPGIDFEYGHNQLCFSFPHALMDTPLALADVQAHQHAIRQCEALMEAMPRPGGLGEQIRQQLMQDGPPFLSLEALAQQQHMSERTLRRHLLQENIRWRDLLTEVKMSLAKQYLMAGNDNITAIALKLGYQDSANFSRAFRQYTGLSPSEWRQH